MSTSHKDHIKSPNEFRKATDHSTYQHFRPFYTLLLLLLVFGAIDLKFSRSSVNIGNHENFAYKLHFKNRTFPDSGL